MGKNGFYGNSADTHGYAHSDGVVRDYPEVANAEPMVDGYEMLVRELSIDGQHILATRIAANLGYKLVEEDEIEPLHTTQEQLDRAFAAWAKAYKRWEVQFAEWEQKHGKR